MKEYFVEYYNNTLKMWGEKIVFADSPLEVIYIFQEDPDYQLSIISIKEKED